jgi:16S rRNA (cytosine967-C5)-methyltransferase
MRTWKREMRRLTVKNAEPIISDSSHDLPMKIKADAAIIDPPCSGTGIFIKTPSLKWRLNSEDLRKYSELQFKMIKNIGKYLKSGGILTYSTCSITLEENEILIEKFLRVQPNFSLVDIKPDIGLPGLRGLKKCRRLYPHKHESSGFFLAKMVKNN